MKYFDNVNERLDEIRTSDFYKPYVDLFMDMYESDKENPILNLSYKDFITFSETGSRVESEKLYFHKRRRLGYLAMLVLIYPEEKKYVDDLCEVIWSICSEVSWVIAPHLHNHMKESRKIIDLFATETAVSLAEILYLLEEHLPQELRELVRTEISERIFDTMENSISWWESLKSNWAAVCAGGVGMTYMYLAPKRFANVKDRIMKCMENYLSGIGDDGCCSEGIDYWYYGFYFYLHFAEMLYRFTDGKEDIRISDKIKRLAEFKQNMILRGNTTVSFSDGKMKTPFMHIGLYSYMKKHYPNAKIPHFDYFTDDAVSNYHGLGHSETFTIPTWIIRDMLWSDPNLKYDEKVMPEYKYYDKTEWYIQNKERYSFAAKAGHNEEEHNHNDVGTFIIATDSGQMICDLGAMEYTRDYFSAEKKYFSNSSRGHCVPIIDGKCQQSGRMYRAKNVSATKQAFTMDIEGAYETDISKIRRTFSVEESNGKSII